MRDKDGRIRPPGGTQGIVLTEPNGATTAVLSRGDAIEIVHGKQELLAFSTTPTNALRLAWFLVWSWWVCATWCGVKLRLWRWALTGATSPVAPAQARGFRTARSRIIQAFGGTLAKSSKSG